MLIMKVAIGLTHILFTFIYFFLFFFVFEILILIKLNLHLKRKKYQKQCYGKLIWVKVFKNESSKIFGRHPLKTLK